MMTCDQSLTQIHNLLDGTLGSEGSIALHTHLDECAACRQEYRQLAATQRLLKQVSPTVDDAARDRLMARFRHAAGITPTSVPARSPARLVRRLAPGFAMAGAFGALWLIFLNSRPVPVDSPLPARPIQVAQLTPLPDSTELAQISHLHAAQSAFALGDEGAEVHEDAMLDIGASFAPTASNSAQTK